METMTPDERRQLVDEIVEALRADAHTPAEQLLELMRAESQLVDVLRVVRRQTNLIVSSTHVLPETGDA